MLSSDVAFSCDQWVSVQCLLWPSYRCRGRLFSPTDTAGNQMVAGSFSLRVVLVCRTDSQYPVGHRQNNLQAASAHRCRDTGVESLSARLVGTAQREASMNQVSTQTVTHLPKAAWCSAKHYLKKQQPRPSGPTAESVLDTVLEQYSEESTVFVHIGLRDINTALDTDPYAAILDKLRSAFDSILVPGFTKSFRETGVFDLEETPPELGAFSGLFFEEATARTPDPLHSVLIEGPYRFEGCVFRDTFSPNGCYGQLSEDNVLCLNIGTPWLVSTQLHYIERVCDVPYAETVEIDGELRVNGTVSQITQRNYDKNNYLYFWNRHGLRDAMVAAGVMDHYSLDGLNVMGVRAGDMQEFLVPKIEADPYYLVT